MRKQRNMAKMKEQIKIPEKDLNKMEIGNLSDAELKTLVIRMLKEISEDLHSMYLTSFTDCSQMSISSASVIRVLLVPFIVIMFV